MIDQVAVLSYMVPLALLAVFLAAKSALIDLAADCHRLDRWLKRVSFVDLRDFVAALALSGYRLSLAN